jgi:hypothetical protein
MLRAVALAAIVLAARAPSPAPANSLTDAWQKILTANASGLSGVAIGTVSPTFEDPFIVTRWPGLMTPTPSSLQGSTNSPTPPDSLAIDCRSSEHCMHHGSCNAARTACICNDGYLTHDPPAGKQCNYERKSQKTAFLYSLFLGLWGVDHFYIGNNGMAVGKLILGCASVFPLCCSCVLCACRKIRERHATRIALPALSTSGSGSMLPGRPGQGEGGSAWTEVQLCPWWGPFKFSGTAAPPGSVLGDVRPSLKLHEGPFGPAHRGIQ